MKTIVVNLIAGPCSGKSTIAAGLFHKLKQQGIESEMSLEFAKDKVYEESFKTMDDQIYIFGKQFHRLWRLNGKCQVVICDSPLPISIFYNKEKSDYFNDFVVEQYNRFNNKMYFIERGDTFQQNGRIQNLEESKVIDKSLIKILDNYHIDYKCVHQSKAEELILDEIMKELSAIS